MQDKSVKVLGSWAPSEQVVYMNPGDTLTGITSAATLNARMPIRSVVRSLWARIILAVVGLTVTFGIVTSTFVINQWRLEDFTRLIRRGYGPLALQSKDLARRSDDLKGYLDGPFENEA